MEATEVQTDLQGVRVRARQNIEQGAVTSWYNAHLARVLKRLNDALAEPSAGGRRRHQGPQ